MDVLWGEVERVLSACTNEPLQKISVRQVGGGSINTAYIVEDVSCAYFVKINAIEYLAMFEAEAQGLAALHSAETIRVPQVIHVGEFQQNAYIIMECIHITSGKVGSAGKLGEQLAALHHSCSDRFGWHRDNTIGTTPQCNQPMTSWVSFWQQHRLQFQLDLAGQQGYRGKLQRLGERVVVDLPLFFDNYSPPASLLHGDLWSGNFAYDEHGEPVIFDPAVYYGDRETDIAMTELFGGFSADFYAAYHQNYPLDGGYKVRKTLYNLYHVLNHLNLFGGSYRTQAESMLTQLCSEV